MYKCFFDKNVVSRKIGGVETYLLNLSRLFNRLGHKVTIYQEANKNCNVDFEGIHIKAVKTLQAKEVDRKQHLYKVLLKDYDKNNDLLIYGADHYSVKTNISRSLSIQHGIGWDLPSSYLTRKRFFKDGVGAWLKKIQGNLNGFNNSRNSGHLVCVDYNFVNWLRTIYPYSVDDSMTVIPNFTKEIANDSEIKIKSGKKSLSVLFARRFTDYRGTRVFSQAISELLLEFKDITITFAGDGNDYSFLYDMWGDNKQVKFIKYNSDDSLNIHLEHDIAVIPSVASEGTSISLAEAMAAGCIPIATNVGGMTNMIINGFNGYICKPTASGIYNTLRRALLLEKAEKKEIIINAYSTAKASFTRERWENDWKSVLKNYQ